MSDARVEAAARALAEHLHGPSPFPRGDIHDSECRELARISLAAADEAEPVISEAEHQAKIKLWGKSVVQVATDRESANYALGDALERAERAETAARDFARALHAIARPRARNDGGSHRRTVALAALRAHPEYSEESGNG